MIKNKVKMYSSIIIVTCNEMLNVPQQEYSRVRKTVNKTQFYRGRERSFRISRLLIFTKPKKANPKN